MNEALDSLEQFCTNILTYCHYFQCNFYNYALIKLISKFQDAHGNQFGQTVKDKSQDYKLIVGYQYQDNTVLRFKRKINTCDTEDLAITVNSPII